jgi:hypothetical protein
VPSAVDRRIAERKLDELDVEIDALIPPNGRTWTPGGRRRDRRT